MRAVCQRVSEASVVAEGRVAGEIRAGLVVLLGIDREDAPREAKALARKVARLRIFEDEDGKFAYSAIDTGGSALVVSQFTLVADTSKGNRPSFTNAAPPERAVPLYEEFCKGLAEEGIPVETGVFGTRMEGTLVNDGPVAVVLDLP